MTRRRRDDRELIPGTKGIYRGTDWNYGVVKVRGAGEIDPKTKRRKAAFREKRFPHAVSIVEIEAWQSKTRAQLLEHAERGSTPGTFKRDAQDYLKDFTKHLTSAKTRKVEIKKWIAEFGDRPRGAIKASDVSRVRSKWLAAGTSPKTINNRCQSLRHLYHSLDGKRAWTPLDDLTDLPVHKTPMRFVDDAVILKVDQELQRMEQRREIRTLKTRARYRVLVSTGRRPSEIMRTEPGDLDLKRRIWLPRDGKGGFSPGVYLNDDMLAAWKFFIAADAWGHYETDRQSELVRQAGWPSHVRLYNARHTVGITLSESGVDLKDVGDMMGHKHTETTRKHYVPVLNSRMQKASEAIDHRFGGWPVAETTVQTAVQTGKAKTGKSRPKSAAKKTTPKRPASSRK